MMMVARLALLALVITSTACIGCTSAPSHTQPAQQDHMITYAVLHVSGDYPCLAHCHIQPESRPASRTQLTSFLNNPRLNLLEVHKAKRGMEDPCKAMLLVVSCPPADQGALHCTAKPRQVIVQPSAYVSNASAQPVLCHLQEEHGHAQVVLKAQAFSRGNLSAQHVEGHNKAQPHAIENIAQELQQQGVWMYRCLLVTWIVVLAIVKYSVGSCAFAYNY